MFIRTIYVLVAVAASLTQAWIASAQGTKQWTTDHYDAFERGSADGVAIRNDGRLEFGMSLSSVYASEESYVWSIEEGANGETYAGLGGDKGGSAALIRIAADASATKIFASKEMAVQAVRISPDRSIFAATSPDGRVYRLNPDGSGERVVFDPAMTTEKSKYIWDLAIARDGTLYVATGSPAAVYRVSPTSSSKPELLFRTGDAHIRSLLLTSAGVLWAGSDGAGVIYRFEAHSPGAKPFAVYASGHKEITSLATDSTGAIYAAAVGMKGPPSLPPLPVTGAIGIAVTLLQPGSASAAGSNSVVPDGSEIDRIAPDGTPQRLASLKEDVVYSLLVHEGQLLVATGNHGKIYRIDPEISGRLTEVARVEASQATALASGAAGVLVGSSNGGRVLRIVAPSPKATYVSEIFDAGQYARWGRAEVQANAKSFDLFVRTGNVPSAMQGWSDWVPVSLRGEQSKLAAGRFAQWRADLREGAVIDSVTLNFLPRNVAPVVEDIAVSTGVRIPAAQAAQQPTVQILLPSAAAAATPMASPVQQDTSNSPITAQKDRTGIVVRWSAHDDNGDDLMFAIWYRGVGETNWRLLKDKVADRFLSFDASLLPDGEYELKVIASDGPIHTAADTLMGVRLSAPFLVDTTPPIPGTLIAHMENGLVHWSFEARDTTSPIARAEVSVDAGPWQYVEPVDSLSDSLQERYDTRSAIPLGDSGESGQGIKGSEHVLAVRVYDRAENVSSAKTVVH